MRTWTTRVPGDRSGGNSGKQSALSHRERLSLGSLPEQGPGEVASSQAWVSSLCVLGANLLISSPEPHAWLHSEGPPNSAEGATLYLSTSGVCRGAAALVSSGKENLLRISLAPSLPRALYSSSSFWENRNFPFFCLPSSDFHSWFSEPAGAEKEQLPRTPLGGNEKMKVETIPSE